MNWLDPEEVQEWFAKNRPHCAGCEGEYNFPQDAAVEFVKTLAKADACCPDICDGASWQAVANLIAKRLEQK